MGYTADNPPRWIRPLLEEYPSLSVETCGYRQGQWAEISYDNENGKKTTRTFSRTITQDIEISAFKQITTNITKSSFDNVAERDELIGDVLQGRLGGYDTFHEALANEL